MQLGPNSSPGLEGVLANDSEDVVGAEDDYVLAVDGDFGSAVFAVENGVADFDVDGGELAGIEPLAGADGDDGAALGLFLSGVGEIQAARGLLFLDGGFNDDTIVQRLNGHMISSVPPRVLRLASFF